MFATFYLISWIFVAIGIALAALRFRTGRYGFAVLAGPLLGFGTFVVLSALALIPINVAGAAFFASLGLGFIATYAVGARRSAWWPLMPAALLLAFAAFIAAESAYPLGGR